ncbi:PKD-like family lipoprotein [Pinibacter aurantiacus]|uniref:PKD-like family protein n=1 Tax=Pinibacter aurantiacus TaxID=2851599 RepID=A0A9E2S4S4_9BACT|nr:PKD-like family lipoprotein [Pinibacter aurantiacus]MBV4355881.1 hypothetical protein [Pinibacter aurantiacus]
MKLSSLFLTTLGGLLLLASCVKDNSSTSFTQLNDVTISNIPDTTTIGVDEKFNIVPLLATVLNDTSNLSYVWYAFDATTQYAADTLSFEHNLTVPAKMAPGSYTLVYKVTDKKTNIFYKSTTKLVVANEFTTGIMVLGNDNGNAVLDFYNTATGKLSTNIYENANGSEALGKNPVSVSYYPKKSSMPAEVLVLNKDGRGGIFADPVTFIKLRGVRQSFYLPLQDDGDLNVTKYVARSTTGLNDYLIIGGKVYNRSVNSGEVLYKPEMLGDFSLAPFGFYETSTRATFYDDKNKRFLAHNNTAGALNPFITDATASIFDANNVGLTMLYGGCTAGNNFFAVCKDGSGTPYILTFLANAQALTFTAKDKYAPTATDLQNATAYTSATTIANYLFYAADTKIYAYNIVSKSGGLLMDIGSGYNINFLELNGAELKVAFVNAQATGKKAGFTTYNIGTVGGLNATETRRKEGICDLIVDLTDKN